MLVFSERSGICSEKWTRRDAFDASQLKIKWVFRYPATSSSHHTKFYYPKPY
jgi:hypothetical protein